MYYLIVNKFYTLNIQKRMFELSYFNNGQCLYDISLGLNMTLQRTI